MSYYTDIIKQRKDRINKLVDSASDETMSMDDVTEITSKMSDEEIKLVESTREMLGGDDRQGWDAIMVESIIRGL